MTSTEMSKQNQALINLGGRLDNIISGITKLGVAYAGYRSANHWSGAIAGLVALQLAQGGNLAGGVAGLGTLGVIGVANIVKDVDNPYYESLQYPLPLPPPRT